MPYFNYSKECLVLTVPLLNFFLFLSLPPLPCAPAPCPKDGTDKQDSAVWIRNTYRLRQVNNQLARICVTLRGCKQLLPSRLLHRRIPEAPGLCVHGGVPSEHLASESGA